MKYIWLAALLTPVVVLAAITYLLYRPGPPPAAQAVLARSLSAHNRTTNQPQFIQSFHHSLQPGAFTAEMSRASYGDSWYFGTTYTADGTAGDPTSRPLPFPAGDLWCATVAGGSTPHTLLLAQHEDMYVASWVVHQPVSEAAVAGLCR
jgi:hypothetical protein